ncbi:MAG: lysophospholipid acyltransferase family protein [Armatimonadota bacterium]
MRAALGDEAIDRGTVDAYFRRLGDLVGFSAVVYRGGIHAGGLERFTAPQATPIERFHTALEEGKGALMVSPHLICHEVMAGVGTDRLPITVLVRKSPEPAYEAIKQRWYSCLGVDVVYRPPKGGPAQALGEMTAAFRALRRNRILALTPDLIQKRGTGIPVRLFDRDAELPAGAFFLAVRTGAPLIPTFFHWENGVYHLRALKPLSVNATDDRDAAVADLAQRWASLFEEFLREHPEMWQFWLDKRWIRWLDETPRLRR